MGQIPATNQYDQYECLTCGQRYNSNRYANQHKKYFEKAYNPDGKPHDRFKKVLVSRNG
jgi:hypothetical protein